MPYGVFVSPEQRLFCPNCGLQRIKMAVSAKPGQSEAEMHHCRARSGIYAPMVVSGVNCKIEPVERGDFVGKDAGFVRLDAEGRPYMSVDVVRDEGRDSFVMAPTAHNKEE